MKSTSYPVIDPIATGRNIVRLRTERGLSVKDLQAYFGFEEPRAIYKWQKGESLPTVDNLFALSKLLNVSMDSILVSLCSQLNRLSNKQQDLSSCCLFYEFDSCSLPAIPDRDESRLISLSVIIFFIVFQVQSVVK